MARQADPSLSAVTADEFLDFLIYLKDAHTPHAGASRRPAAPTVGLAPASREAHWKTLRSLWVFAERRQWLTDTQRNFFRGDVPRPAVPEQVRPTYAPADFKRLLDNCQPEDTERGARDRALLLLMLESGMRISEACSLTDEVIEIERRLASVVGKGNKSRFIYWSWSGAAALAQYLELRRGPSGGPLFRSVGSRSAGMQLTPNAVRAWLRRVAHKAGITLPKNAPLHALRHSFAHNRIEDGADIFEVAQFLGHSDVRTTTIYLRQNPEKLRDLHDRLFASRNGSAPSRRPHTSSDD